MGELGVLTIKEIITDEDYQEVTKYLARYGMAKPNSICLYVAYDDSGNIVGVSGFEYVPIIEPLCANSGSVADKLYEHVIEQMKSKVVQINADRIECYVSDSRVNKIRTLCEKKGFNFVEKTNRFSKSI